MLRYRDLNTTEVAEKMKKGERLKGWGMLHRFSRAEKRSP